MTTKDEANTALLYGVTGSGKTEVFLARDQRSAGIRPRRNRHGAGNFPHAATIERFHRYFGGRVAVLHSGLSMSERMDEWKRIRDGKADIVVGTRSAVFAPLAKIGLIVMDEEQESSYKSEKSPRFHARDVARVRAAPIINACCCSLRPRRVSRAFTGPGRGNTACWLCAPVMARQSCRT